MKTEKTLRDEFAMLVLPVLVTDRNGFEANVEDNSEPVPEPEPISGYVRSIALASYMFADAMIEARKK